MQFCRTTAVGTPLATRTLGRILGIADLAGSGPLPRDVPDRLPLVDVELTARRTDCACDVDVTV